MIKFSTLIVRKNWIDVIQFLTSHLNIDTSSFLTEVKTSSTKLSNILQYLIYGNIFFLCNARIDMLKASNDYCLLATACHWALFIISYGEFVALTYIIVLMQKLHLA